MILQRLVFLFGSGLSINGKFQLDGVKCYQLREVIEAFHYIRSKVDIFELYNVTHYLNAVGLSVAEKYQRRGVATALLEARKPLMKACGLKLTRTIYSSDSSQHCAERAGFKSDSEVT